MTEEKLANFPTFIFYCHFYFSVKTFFFESTISIINWIFNLEIWARPFCAWDEEIFLISNTYWQKQLLNYFILFASVTWQNITTLMNTHYVGIKKNIEKLLFNKLSIYLVFMLNLHLLFWTCFFKNRSIFSMVKIYSLLTHGHWVFSLTIFMNSISGWNSFYYTFTCYLLLWFRLFIICPSCRYIK